jgi:hypothetical protein
LPAVARLAQAYEHAETLLVRLAGRRFLMAAGLGLMIVGTGQATPALPDASYATVAQVLPVFALLAVVEGQYFAGADEREPFDRFFLKGVLLLPIIAELAALAAPLMHRDHVLVRGVVIVGTATAIFLLWMYATIGPARQRPPGLLTQAERVRRVVEGDDAS